MTAPRNLFDNVRKHIVKSKREQGLTRGKVNIKKLGAKKLVSGRITLTDYNMVVGLNPDSKIFDERKVKHFLGNSVISESPIEALGKDVGEHEVAHGAVCPVNTEYHYETFIEPIKAILESMGKYAMENSVSNALQDIIINFKIAERRRNNGMIVFWHHEGREKGFTKFYESFVKLNIYLMFDNGSPKTPFRREQKNALNLINPHFSNDSEIYKSVAEFISRAGLSRHRYKNEKILLDRENWKNLSRLFAECFGNLLEDRDMDMNTSPILRENEPPPDDIVFKRYKQGKNLPNYIEHTEALEQLYDRLAGEIPVFALTKKEGGILKINYRYRFYDPETDDYSKIRLNRYGINNKGELAFKVPKYNFPVKIKVKSGEKNFPTVCVGLVDGSGTMRFGLPDPYDNGDSTMIPWGDKSRFHHALLGVWGIEKFFKRNNILTNVIGMIFSHETLVGVGAKNAKKTLLNPPFMDTNIDVSVFDDVPAGSVIITISDGDVHNWNEIKKDFIVMASEMNYFHLQIGGESEMSSDLENAGFHVNYVNNREDLTNLIIRLGVKNYIDYMTK